MDITYIIVLLFLTAYIGFTHGNVNESMRDREPRVNVRSVKLYPGSKLKSKVICTNEGFQPDPMDCAVFYRCMKTTRDKYTILKFRCGPGTIYDLDTEVCNHPQNTKRTNCDASITITMGPTEENEIEAAYQQLSPPSSDSLTNSMNTISSTQKNLNLFNTNIWTTHVKQNISLTEVTNSPLSEIMYDKCISDGFMGDSQNCRKFYRCVENGKGGYTRYEFLCSDSTIWDDELQTCNHPWAVKKRRCDISKMFKVKTNYSDKKYLHKGISYTVAPQINFDSNITETLMTMKPITHAQNIIDYNEHEKRKQSKNVEKNEKIITSISSESSIQTENYNSNNEIQTKLYIDHKKEESQTQGYLRKETLQYTTPTMKDIPIYQTYYEINQIEDNTKIDKSVECIESGFKGDLYDCKKFYRCVDNGDGGYIKFEFSCGEGTVWDSELETCNHAWAVKEKCRRTLSTESPIQSSSKFTMSYSTSKLITTAEKGHFSNEEQNQYQSATSATSLVIQTKNISKEVSLQFNESNCEFSGFLGDVNDCTKFYKCVESGNGKFVKYEYKCGKGTAWDHRIQACNHVWAMENCVSRENGNKTETDSPTSIAGSPITTVSLIQSTTQLNHDYNKVQNQSSALFTTTSAEQIESSNIDKTNICTYSGFMGDKKDCKIFYRCVESGSGLYIRYEFSCGYGTVWDPKIEACNHAWAVKKCGDGKDVTSGERQIERTTTYSTYYSTGSDEISSSKYQAQHDKSLKNPDHNLVTEETITSTSKNINELQICVQEGFVGDKKDCKKYYRCVANGSGEYIRHEFSCGEGTTWDSEINVCNHQKSVKNSCNSFNNYSSHDAVQNFRGTEKSTTTISAESSTEKFDISTTNKYNLCESEGFHANVNDCRKFFQCVENGRGGYTKHDFICGEGTIWVQNIQTCDHGNDILTCSYSVQSTSESTNEYSSTISTTQSTQSKSPNKESLSSNPSQNATPSNEKCISEGFYSNENNCKKFYRCVNDEKGGYIRYDFSCGEGTAWDENIQACNHENQVNSCKKIHVNEKPLSEKEDSHERIDNTSTTMQSIQSSTEILTSDVKDTCNNVGYFGNTKNCRKFHRCVANEKDGFTRYDFICGEGTIWDQKIMACNHPQDVEYSSCNENENDTTSSTMSMSSTTASNTTETIDTESNSQRESNCTHDSSSVEFDTKNVTCNETGFHADSSDCKKFYRCVDNEKGEYTKYDFICGEGTIWDQEITACNHPQDVANPSCKKGQEGTVVYTTTTSPSTSDSSTSDSTPLENNSQNESNCTQESSTIDSVNDSVICSETGFYADPNDCKKFYRCVDNGKGGFTKYNFTCGEGTIWDQEISTCNHPQDVAHASCKKDENSTSSAPTTSSSTSVSSTTDSIAIESSSQSQYNCTQESSSENPKKKKITCSKAGFYAHPEDCKKFYRCVDWDGNGQRFSVYYFNCGEGTIWDPELETCNYEESVNSPRDCNEKQTENINTTEELTTTEGGSTAQKEDSTTELTTQESTPTSTTSQPTIQQSTTTKQATEQSSSTEQTTTQQSVTNEQTTTQHYTTNEQSTHDTIVTEETTTQKTTTNEQTTTQVTTTTDQTTTQKPSTSEQTTTQPTTTEETTYQSTTNKETTQQSTTQQSSSNEQTTTTENITEKSTISEQSTPTEQSTTEQLVSSEQSVTIEETTTEQSTTTESTTTEGLSTERSTTTTEESSSEYLTTDQTTTEQTTETQTSRTESTLTTEQNDETTTQSGQETTTVESSHSSKECPKTDNDENLYVCPTSFRRHPKYCNLFYQCTEDDNSYDLNIAVFSCPNNTIYDESMTKCVEEEKADKKCNGEIARRHRIKRLGTSHKDPIMVNKNTLACPAIGHFPFELNDGCSPIFLKCEKAKSGKIRGYVYQCPEGYFYWLVSRRCEKKSKVIDCTKSESNSWSKKWQIPTEKTNVAP